MTRDEAKQILSLYRPWSEGELDPAVAEALALAKSDAELGEWFRKHCEAQTAIHRAFDKVEIPPGLKQQIISERPPSLTEAKRRTLMLVAAAVTIIAIGSLAISWLAQRPSTAQDMSFSAYRTRMVKYALRMYGMAYETNDLTAIRNYLSEHQAHANCDVPATLAGTTSTGCDVLSWQGHRVTMICFHSGKPLPPGEKTDLFLFVIDQGVAVKAPTSGQPRFAQVSKLLTASWAEGNEVYLLAAPGNEEFLKKYL